MKPRWSLSELIAPLPLAAVALLVINDVWLKPAFHNALTGKISDVAVCFFLPLYLAAVLGLVLPRWPRRTRVAVGCAVTALLYTALELSPAVADVFCAANAGVGAWLGIHRRYTLTADPTDLATLVLVPLAYLHGVGRAPPARATSPHQVPG